MAKYSDIEKYILKHRLLENKSCQKFSNNTGLNLLIFVYMNSLVAYWWLVIPLFLVIARINEISKLEPVSFLSHFN